MTVKLESVLSRYQEMEKLGITMKSTRDDREQRHQHITMVYGKYHIHYKNYKINIGSALKCLGNLQNGKQNANNKLIPIIIHCSELIKTLPPLDDSVCKIDINID